MVEKGGLGRVAVNDGDQAAITQFSDDSQLGGRGGDRSVDIGADVRLRQNSVAADTGTNTYGEARVATRPSFGAGLVTFDPPPTSAQIPENIDKDDNYTEALFLDLPLRFEDGCNHMNGVIQEYGWVKQVVPITDVTDGDMLQSGTTNWNAGAGTETIAKNSATFGAPYRYLSVVGSAASQYTHTATRPVEQGASYYYEVCAFKTAANDGSIQLYDITNSAALTLTTDDIDERVPQILRNSVSMGATTEQIQARILKSDTGSTQGVGILWVILRRNDQRIFTIQDRPAKVLWLGELRATNETTFASRSWPSMTPVQAKAVQIDAGLWQYHLDRSLSGYSLWYEEFIQPAVMDSDDDTTAIEIEDLAWVTMERWLQPLRGLPQWAAKYEKAAFRAGQVRANRMAQIQGMRQEAQYRISPLGV